MKIMYYELIKMLIEYERNKQPEVKTTSKNLYLTSNNLVFVQCPISKFVFVQKSI